MVGTTKYSSDLWRYMSEGREMNEKRDLCSSNHEGKVDSFGPRKRQLRREVLREDRCTNNYSKVKFS